MKSFSIRADDIVRIVAGLTADELARRFGQFIETLIQARWTAETPIGEGGVGANALQIAACATRAAEFFDLEDEALEVKPTDTFGDWGARLEGAVRLGLTHFRFYPATPAGFVDTRHEADDIWMDAGAVAGIMQGRRRVLSLVSPHSLLGLVTTVLAPNLQGLEVKDVRGLEPDELSHTIAFGDLVVATPTLWRYLAETLPGIANNVMAMSFGERLGPDLASRLRQRGIGAIRELYGATETGVVSWRDSAPDLFVPFSHWRRDGEALIRERASGQHKKLIPMDDLDWQGEGFLIGPRRDGAVQIGGLNVFPQSIGAIINAHPDVDECSVRVSQRSGALDRLIADITLVRGRTSNAEMAWSIDEWCRERLRPVERPRIYAFFET